MTPLFVFCADLHLEDGAWSTRPGIYGDSYYSFSQIVDYCVSHKLPLILGGDVLEKKSNAARPIAKLCEGLSRMQAAAVPVYYIQGNHEYDRNAPWLSVHPWPVHMHNAVVSINGVPVYGLDWLPRGEIQEALKQVPVGVEILATHQVWKDFMGNIGRTECELTDVHHVQNVLAGDFHVTKVVNGTNAQGKPISMLSPGSTCMQDISESPEKFFFVISRDTDGTIAFTPKKLHTRPFLDYVAETQEELDDLCAGWLAARISAVVAEARDAGVPEEIQKPLVRIKFNKQLPDAYLRLLTAVGETAHVFCAALTDNAKTKPAAESRPAAANTLLVALEDLLGTGTEEYRLAAALVNAADPSKELDALFNGYVDLLGEVTDATTAPACEELGAPSGVDV